ncbi:ThuA domain-containing protein [Glycomyces tarimensis]
MKRPNALIVRGGWEGHAPVEATELFLPFLEDNGYTVRIEASPAAYAEDLGAVDLIVQCVTMSEITEPQLDGLRNAVAAGTGLIGWHGGIADSYRSSSDYLQLIGGQFACHPAKEPELRTGAQADYYLPHTVEISDLGREHPITRGIDAFELHTEQYWVLHDDLIDILATTTHPTRPWHQWHRPIVSPAVWTRQWGAGRIVVATPGHSVDILRHESVRIIIERGMLWATRTVSA